MERQKGTTVAGKKGKDPNALLWLSKRRKTLLRRRGKKKAPKMPTRRRKIPRSRNVAHKKRQPDPRPFSSERLLCLHDLSCFAFVPCLVCTPKAV